MALTLSIDIDSASFEDLATLISAAGAAGADDSSAVEFDEDNRVLKVIIEEPVAPDFFDDSPTLFDLNDDDDLPADEWQIPFDSERDGPPRPLNNVADAIHDFIDNIADGLSTSGRGFGRGSFGRGLRGYNFPSPDHLHRLADDYFRNFHHHDNEPRHDGYEWDRFGDESPRRAPRPPREEPQDEPRSDSQRHNPFGSGPFGGSGAGSDFGELRDAGESFLRGLSDFINDRVDRRTNGGKRNNAPGYGSFVDPNATDGNPAGHPEGTSQHGQFEGPDLGKFMDFSEFEDLDDTQDDSGKDDGKDSGDKDSDDK